MKLRAKDYILVALQGIIFIAYLLDFAIFDIVIPFTFRAFGLVIGIFGVLILILSILQLNKNLSPFPTPKANSQLIQNGLYKYERHPIYTGVLLIFTGYALYSASLYKMAITILLLIVFIIKSTYEEKKLMERFSNYKTYKKQTGRFFPKLFKA